MKPCQKPRKHPPLPGSPASRSWAHTLPKNEVSWGSAHGQDPPWDGWAAATPSQPSDPACCLSTQILEQCK